MNKIFKLLDSDKDGLISRDQIDLSTISDDVLRYEFEIGLCWKLYCSSSLGNRKEKAEAQ